MAFHVSVTHWSLLTPFCHQAGAAPWGEKGAQPERKGQELRRWRRNLGPAEVGAEVSGSPKADHGDSGMRTEWKGWGRSEHRPFWIQLSPLCIWTCKLRTFKEASGCRVPPRTRSCSTHVRREWGCGSPSISRCWRSTSTTISISSPSSSPPSCLFTPYQPPNASCSIVLFKVLYGKMFYFSCLLCIMCVRSIVNLWQYSTMELVVSWGPRLTSIDLWKNWTYQPTCGPELVHMQGTYYRRRMTHTLEVPSDSQLGVLNLNSSPSTERVILLKPLWARSSQQWYGQWTCLLAGSTR